MVPLKQYQETWPCLGYALALGSWGSHQQTAALCVSGLVEFIRTKVIGMQTLGVAKSGEAASDPARDVGDTRLPRHKMIHSSEVSDSAKERFDLQPRRSNFVQSKQLVWGF